MSAVGGSRTLTPWKGQEPESSSRFLADNLTPRPAQSGAHREQCLPSPTAPAFSHEPGWRWVSRIADVEVERCADLTTPESVLCTLQLRRIVRARVALHVEQRPDLAVAVPVLTGAARPRDLHSDRIYTLTAALRARLRDDEVLSALWDHSAE